MTYDRQLPPTFRPKIKSLASDDYAAELAKLLATRSRAELLAVFAHNVQFDPTESGGYLNGPISLDPSLDVTHLYEMHVVDKTGDAITTFGSYVTHALCLNPESLSSGRIDPILL